MHRMESVLCLFFHRYGRLSLPGFGKLEQIVTPAQLDFPNKKVYAPKVSIKYSVEEGIDPVFINWLSAELSILPAEAEQGLYKFIADLKRRIAATGESRWEGIGVFRLSDDQQILVEDISTPDAGFVIAEKVIRSGSLHTVLVGEAEKSSKDMEVLLSKPKVSLKTYWWVFTCLFFIIGIASLLFIRTYLPESWKRKGNYSPIKIEQAPVLILEYSSSN